MRCMIIALVLLLLAPPASAASAKPLSGGESRYPHAIRLAHGRFAGDVVVSVNNWRETQIYRGRRSFKLVAKFTDPEAAASSMCCAHIYELPSRVGALPAGTLLWAGSTGFKDVGMSLRVWRSLDGGSSWSFLSTCASSSGGIWEPELSVDASGRLVCHFADEEDWRTHSQVLSRTFSVDGVSWSAKTYTVAVQPRGYRPGMAHVRRLPGGSYFMTYEICGQRDQYFCSSFFRTSADGWDWGSPDFPGTPLRSREGRYFAHTPSIALGPGGRLVLTGQMLMHPSGKVDSLNGARLFINDRGGAGEWYEAPAPVPVPSARDVNCPNYHPALVVAGNGESVLEFASDYDSSGLCVTRYASGPLPAVGQG
ncbi:exo-alpha-sialidase [Lentzea sp. NBRC 105346]|uniref:exo-alpha-sialidase n=1 Tax=Lentzea sp. NBRC 105346 TaxID=3032205 RepID=UPI002553E64D|nr:exo-alpha-sialidase [Lentzea sp. NBRC 105346]